MHLPRQAQVVWVASLPGNQSQVLPAPDRLADPGAVGCPGHAKRRPRIALRRRRIAPARALGAHQCLVEASLPVLEKWTADFNAGNMEEVQSHPRVAGFV